MYFCDSETMWLWHALKFRMAPVQNLFSDFYIFKDSLTCNLFKKNARYQGNTYKIASERSQTLLSAILKLVVQCPWPKKMYWKECVFTLQWDTFHCKSWKNLDHVEISMMWPWRDSFNIFCAELSKLKYWDYHWRQSHMLVHV